MKPGSFIQIAKKDGSGPFVLHESDFRPGEHVRWEDRERAAAGDAGAPIAGEAASGAADQSGADPAGDPPLADDEEMVDEPQGNDVSAYDPGSQPPKPKRVRRKKGAQGGA